MKELVSYEGLHCANCSHALQGEFCHHCGQSVHSVLKPVHHMTEEAIETILHIDGRILHTLPPLFLKPGFLTLEYFSGRRMRYIAPFRLMFVLCLLAFFLCHLAIDRIGLQPSPLHVHTSGADFAHADDADDVQDLLGKQLKNAQQACVKLGDLIYGNCMQAAETTLRKQATDRLTALHADPSLASAKVVPVPPFPAGNDDQPDHFEAHVPWLPAFANAWLSQAGQRAGENMHAAFHGTGEERAQAIERLEAGIFGRLPQAMLVMIPLFALLLKLFYVFKRRLYMEHLIVALHSHAFLFLCLLLGVLLDLLAGGLAPHAAWVKTPLHWLEWGLALWSMAYLLLMQKRIYHQGWPMTLVKYWCVGWCYFWLLLWVLVGAMLLGAAY
ncbi:DUF3667 domain-containing protein [Fulvimonas sp. R45]|uniref:DUF3667 domain-containing protein n=1 Tax=Fulvimonas sp. R45 TaxID=3045937 RepID=UPI00265EBE1E|nr:DUF3667 domain-containing protein [Fulvimonas sp. R45]MDO1527540.1 DUF3667 domain-containing protein [Fulvimonas sp. R45]